MKEKFATWIKGIISEQIKPVLKNQEELKKLITDKIEKQPCGQCWECSNGIYRADGYQVWMSKMFCSRKCFDEHRFKLSQPDEKYQKYDGHVLQVISPVK